MTGAGAAPGPAKVRLLVVDDAELNRMGLRTLAATTSDLIVVGEAPAATEALDLARQLDPDLVLVAIDGNTLDGLALIRSLSATIPACRIIATGRWDGDECLHQAVQAGARGYILRDIPAADIANALRAVHAGRRSFPPVALERLAERIGKRELTTRERQVLLLVAEGWNNAKIAANLGIAPGTVKIHVKQILSKLGADDRTEATAFAWKRGFMQMAAHREPRSPVVPKTVPAAAGTA